MMTTAPTGSRARLATLLTGATLLAASGLSGQEPPLGAPAPPEPPCVCDWSAEGPMALRSFFRSDRARIGVALGETARVGGRSGIRLNDVEEGGPADRAGIRAGDVLLAVDGEQLGEEPIDRLLDLLADVEPGDTISVEYGRDGSTGTARVVTERRQAFSFAGPGARRAVRAFPRRGEMRIAGPGARMHMRRLFGGGLELVEMNEGLGDYFGTDDGVLVTATPEGSDLGLRAGDVILSIDGRAVQDPAHARSIVASYRPDEPISFEVMRDRRTTTVTGSRGAR